MEGTLLFRLLLVLVAVDTIFTTRFFADNGRSQTVPINVKGRDKNKFENEMLDMMDLDSVPRNPTQKEKLATSFMLDLFKSIQNEDASVGNLESTNQFSYVTSRQGDGNSFSHSNADDLFDVDSADTIMSFVDQIAVHHATSPDSAPASGDLLKHLHFDLSDVQPEFKLIGAELRILRNFSDPIDKRPGNLNVYSPRISPLNGAYELHLVATAKLKPETSWVVLNVTNAFDFWRQNMGQNSGLLLEVLDHKGERQLPFDAGISSAFMVGFMNTQDYNARKRRKRSLDYREYRSTREQYYEGYVYGDVSSWTRTPCQRKTFFVSFKELKWDKWVIAPGGYNAYYCQGECSFPLTAALNATNHAIVQLLAHLYNTDVPKPCCAPTQLSQITILFYDDTHNVILKKYREMIVRSCGCH